MFAFFDSHHRMHPIWSFACVMAQAHRLCIHAHSSCCLPPHTAHTHCCLCLQFNQYCANAGLDLTKGEHRVRLLKMCSHHSGKGYRFGDPADEKSRDDPLGNKHFAMLAAQVTTPAALTKQTVGSQETVKLTSKVLAHVHLVAFMDWRVSMFGLSCMRTGFQGLNDPSVLK